MSLFIILGFDGPGADAVPFPVYVGRDGAAGQEAMLASNAARFELLQNPPTRRKANDAQGAERFQMDDLTPWLKHIDKRKGTLEAMRKQKAKIDAAKALAPIATAAAAALNAAVDAVAHAAEAASVAQVNADQAAAALAAAPDNADLKAASDKAMAELVAAKQALVDAESAAKTARAAADKAESDHKAALKAAGK